MQTSKLRPRQKAIGVVGHSPKAQRPRRSVARVDVHLVLDKTVVPHRRSSQSAGRRPGRTLPAPEQFPPAGYRAFPALLLERARSASPSAASDARPRSINLRANGILRFGGDDSGLGVIRKEHVRESGRHRDLPPWRQASRKANPATCPPEGASVRPRSWPAPVHDQPRDQVGACFQRLRDRRPRGLPLDVPEPKDTGEVGRSRGTGISLSTESSKMRSSSRGPGPGVDSGTVGSCPARSFPRNT